MHLRKMPSPVSTTISIKEGNWNLFQMDHGVVQKNNNNKLSLELIPA